MDQLIIYVALTVLMPIGLLIIFLEKRARRVMLSFLCGALVCLTAYYFNNFVYELSEVSSNLYSFTLGAIVEESLKFIPLLIFCLVVKKGKRQTVAMSFALGVGFCVVENFYYLINLLAEANISWIVIRCVGTGLMHSISTSFIGYGLFRARTGENKNRVFIGALTYAIAVSYHVLFNFLTSIEKLEVIGVLIPLFSYILLFFFVKKDRIKAFFEDEEEKNEING